MGYVTLPENFAHELGHTGCDKDHFDLGCSLLENLAELSLADKFAIAVVCLKEQVSKIILPHELHT